MSEERDQLLHTTATCVLTTLKTRSTIVALVLGGLTGVHQIPAPNWGPKIFFFNSLPLSGSYCS